MTQGPEWVAVVLRFFMPAGLGVSLPLPSACVDHSFDSSNEVLNGYHTSCCVFILQVRRLLLALRDLERAPEGAPQPPDVLALQRAERLADVGVQGLVGAAAKVAALAILGASKRL